MKRIRNFHHTKPGRVLLFILGLIVLLALLLFTPVGNRIMAPIVESSLSSALDTPINIEDFSLSHNRFQLLFQDGYGNTVSTQGGFSALTLRMYAHYRIECFNANGFNPISQPFKTEGSLSGGIASFFIQGTGYLLDGHLIYKMELHRFALSSIHLQLEKIAYEPLMHLLDYPSNTDTTLSGEILLKGFDQRDVKGNIRLSTATTQFSPTPIKEDQNSSSTLRDLLADTSGHVKAFNTNIRLDLSLEHAGILEQFVTIALGGKLSLSGSLEGDDKQLRLIVNSDVAHSDTRFKLFLDDLEPSSISFVMKQADAQEVFQLFALPAPIRGTLSAYADLNKSNGEINVDIQNASTVPSILKTSYQITQPLIRFNADVNAHLSSKGAHYRAAFTSDLARLEVDNTTTHEQMLRELLLSIPNDSPRQ